MKATGVSVLILSKETGISPYKIYKWLDSKGKPKYEDTQVLEKWVSGTQELVPERNGFTNHITTKNPDLTPGLVESLRETINAQKQTIAVLTAQLSQLQGLTGLEAMMRKVFEQLDRLEAPGTSQPADGKTEQNVVRYGQRKVHGKNENSEKRATRK